MVEESEQALRDRVAGRLTARDRQHEEEHVELQLGELLRATFAVVELGIGEDAPHVIGGMRPLLVAEALRVLEELQLREIVVSLGERRLWIGGAHERVGAAEHPRTVRLGDADDVGDEVHGQQVRDIAHEVAVAPLDDVADDVARPHVDALVQASDHAGREPGADELPQARVGRWVRSYERVTGVIRIGAADRRPAQRGEGLPVAVRLDDLGVAEDRPERHALGGAGHGHAPVVQHRGLVAELGEELVRESVAVELRIGEVEVGGDHRPILSQPRSHAGGASSETGSCRAPTFRSASTASSP